MDLSGKAFILNMKSKKEPRMGAIKERHLAMPMSHFPPLSFIQHFETQRESGLKIVTENVHPEKGMNQQQRLGWNNAETY